MQELMKEGRKGVQEIDGTLNRAEKVVEDTLQIGQQVRSTDSRQAQALQDRHAGPTSLAIYCSQACDCNGQAAYGLLAVLAMVSMCGPAAD
jgi:hypothetical protein